MIRRLYDVFLRKVLWKHRFPAILSVDLTSRCNLRCDHCYLRHQGRPPDLGAEAMLDRIRRLKRSHPSLRYGGWVGGEPLLRRDLLAECTRLFQGNMIVTNGTLPLMPLAASVYSVSVDGTRGFHDGIRGDGTYETIRENIARADGVTVNLNCVLSRQNVSCLEAFVDEWRPTGVRGISFGFYTPSRHPGHDPLVLPPADRDAAIDRLQALRREHGGFILNSPLILELMRPHRSGEVTSRCLAPRAVHSIDSAGRTKRPCVMGPDIDCTRCGCFVSFAIDSIVRRLDLASVRTVRRFWESAAPSSPLRE